MSSGATGNRVNLRYRTNRDSTEYSTKSGGLNVDKTMVIGAGSHGSGHDAVAMGDGRKQEEVELLPRYQQSLVSSRVSSSSSSSLNEPLLAAISDDDGGGSDDSRQRILGNNGRNRQQEAESEEVKEKTESSFSIAFQVFLPYIVAGFGTVGAGMVLDIVQHWEIFEEVSEIFILVPALLGLKGNLEMTLASRLSTQANLGNMDNRRELLRMISGNLTLTQAQALVVGFLASLAAMVMGWIPQGKFNVRHGLLLCTSSMLTASLASLILGLLMIGIVVLSRKVRINPDNIATPVAASLGDLTTLALLASISAGLYHVLHTLNQVWAVAIGLVICLLFIPLWLTLSRRNEYVSEVVETGWTPVICAMAISSVGGLILDMALSGSNKIFVGIAVYQPVINGVGGNLVAVQSSRMSTELHQSSTIGTLPPGQSPGCVNPIKAFFSSSLTSKTCRVLMMMVIPGHLIFLYVIGFMGAGHTSHTWKFVMFYLIASVIQVVILLYVCQWMVCWIWSHGDDPDNFAIPYLTALGDLLGTGLLALTFYILYVTGDRDADVAD